MPDMDGIEILKNVRASGNTIPFILFTGRGREEVVIEAINSGADFYMQKGGDPTAQFAELEHKIRQAVARRQAERSLADNQAALQASEEKFRDMVETSPDILWDTDAQGVFTYVSPQSTALVGYAPEEIVGRTIFSFVQESALPAIEEIFRGCVRTKKTLPGVDLPLRCRDGHILDMEIRAITLLDRNGAVRGFRGTARDVTERKSAADELQAAFEQITASEEELRGQYEELARGERLIRESEENFQSLVESAPDAIYISVGERFAYVNPAMVRLMGAASADQLLGMPLYDRIHPSYHEAIHERVRIVTGERRPVGLRETVYLKMDGTPVDIESAVATFRYRDKFAGLVILRDITRRKQNEQLLRESETKFRTLFNNTSDAIYIHEVLPDNRPGTFLEVNDTLCSRLGYTRGELLAMGVGDIVSDAHRLKMQEFSDQIAKKRFHTFYGEHRRKDGSVFPVEISSHRFALSGREIVLAAARDITERREAEDALRAAYGQITASEEELRQQVEELKQREVALRESEEKYRSVIENIQDVYYRSDRDGNVVIASPSALSLFGYASLDEILGKPITETFYLDRDERKTFLDLLDRTGSVHEYETRLRKKDGTPITVSTASHYYYDAQGKVAGVEGILRDITGQKKMEEALKDSTQHLSDIISFLPDATFAIDRNGTVISWNRAMEEMTGVPAAQILGKGDYAYAVPFYGKKRPILIDLVFAPANEIAEQYSFVRVSGDVLTAETVNATPLGRTVVLWGKAAPLYDSEGKRTGAIESIRDITDRKMAEGALGSVNRKLKLLTGITRHDIRNQLSILRGHLALLQKEQPDLSTGAHFRKIIAAAGYISSMIQFTKEYESIGVNAPSWHDCRTLAGAAAAQATAADITVRNDIPAGTEVFADPLIARVFYNLADNAVRYGGKITTIRFSAGRSGVGPLIICEDDGEGVPTDDKEKIFERGFGKNTGLGLFFAREILGITGITIRETGVPGGGARFEMAVPEENYRVRSEDRGIL